MTNNLFSTAIPNIFIDEYMPFASSTSSVVYIFFYRYGQAGIFEFCIKDVSEKLNLKKIELLNCLKYWQDEGIIKVVEEDETFSIEFLPIVKRVAAKIKNGVRPTYSPQELEIYKQKDERIANLFSEAEKILGKYLTFNDLETIFGFYEWLRLPIDVVLFLLKHYADKEKRNVSYIEKVATSWAENDIRSIEAAEQYVEASKFEFKEIMKALGLSRRTPAPVQMEYMEKWLTEFNMPLELILIACEKTIIKISEPNFSYVDKILESWKENSIKTAEQAKLEDEKFKLKNGKKAPVKINRFVNFKQRKWDYDKISEVEDEYLEQFLKS